MATVDYNAAPANAVAANQRMDQAWKEQNPEAYIAAYNDFANFFQLPHISSSDDPNAIILKSSTNGAIIGHRHKTTELERPAILAKTKLSSQLLSKLPLEFRQGMLTYFLENTFPKIAYAAAVAQTANMGKAIQESVGEVDAKGKVWFKFAASEEARDYIENYAENGIKTGWDVKDKNGKPVTSMEEFEAAEGPFLITKYPNNPPAMSATSEAIVKGSGISYESPATNYLALAFPGLSIPIAVGNASISKVPSKSTDGLAIANEAFLHDAEEYFRTHADTLPVEVRKEVNLSSKVTRDAIIDGMSVLVTSRGWEAFANTFRIVCGMEAGADTYENRMASKHISDQDKRNTIIEADADNVMFIDKVDFDTLETTAGNHLKRVASNSGMICTRINGALIHEAVFDDYAKITEAKFAEYDANAEDYIGSPHDPDTTQGAHTDLNGASKYLSHLQEMKDLGAKVTGGRVIHLDSGGCFLTPACIIWPADKTKSFEEVRERSVEQFFPVTNIAAVKDVQDAARITNLDNKGLTGCVISDSNAVIADFIESTNLGSYNIGNPKLGSDNSPLGEHIGHYRNVKVGTEGRVVDIEHNGPTGGLAQIAHHLGAPHNSPEHSQWRTKESTRGAIESGEISLAG